MGVFDSFIRGYVIDTSWYTGSTKELSADMIERWKVHIVGLFVVGMVWFLFFTLLYWLSEVLSYKFLPKYAKFRQIEKTDWTSRIVATVMILASAYFSLTILFLGDSANLEPKDGIVGESYEDTEFVLHKYQNSDLLFWLYHAYALLLGYEIYDLKNCINLKMTSGVIHHAVLIVMFPIGWSAASLSVPSLYMTTLSYCSNLPAHLRSFMLHTGFRESRFYQYNKWAWWVAYIVFRLFGIPWFSAHIYFCVPALRLQTPLFSVLWFFSAMVVHYMLSLYWFVNMSRTMFPPKDYDLKRVESFGALPKGDGGLKNAGGQKFD